MNLSAAEAKMLKQLMNICFEDKIDMYLDDIKTFNDLRRRLQFPNPLKGNNDKPESGLKAQARKFYNRRTRHKNKQKLKGIL